MKKQILGFIFSVALLVGGLSTIDAQVVTDPGNGDPKVTCNCAFWGGNNQCRANNMGQTCHTGSEDCRSADSNCGD